MILPGTWHQKAVVDCLLYIAKERKEREKYPMEYPVPLYRHVVCDNCRKGFDSHKHMDCICPKCGGPLVSIV